MARKRNSEVKARAVTVAERAQMLLHLWMIAALLTLIVRALVS